jgi:hypothetical protein
MTWALPKKLLCEPSTAWKWKWVLAMYLPTLGLPDADKLKIKSGLVIEITKAMRKLGLTQKGGSRTHGYHPTKGLKHAAWRFHQSV